MSSRVVLSQSFAVAAMVVALTTAASASVNARLDFDKTTAVYIPSDAPLLTQISTGEADESMAMEALVAPGAACADAERNVAATPRASSCLKQYPASRERSGLSTR